MEMRLKMDLDRYKNGAAILGRFTAIRCKAVRTCPCRYYQQIRLMMNSIFPLFTRACDVS